MMCHEKLDYCLQNSDNKKESKSGSTPGAVSYPIKKKKKNYVVASSIFKSFG